MHMKGKGRPEQEASRFDGYDPVRRVPVHGIRHVLDDGSQRRGRGENGRDIPEENAWFGKVRDLFDQLTQGFSVQAAGVLMVSL